MKKLKFLQLFLILGIFLTITLAKSEITYAASYNGMEYVINAKGTITIMEYTGYSANVTVPSYIGGIKVTNIGDNAFEFSEVVNVTLPSTITDIGISAFQYSELQTINLPSSIVNIGDYAFSFTNLKKVVIPSNVKIIGTGVFEDCSYLTSVTLPNNGTIISSYAFGYCSSLTTISIPSSYIYIDSSAFDACYALKSFYFQGNVPYINGSYFYGTSSSRYMYYYYGNKGFLSNWDDSAVEKCILRNVTNLKGARVSSTSVKLTWNIVPYAAKYKIYRSTSATGTYSYYKTVSTNAFTDTGLTANRTYYYKIVAYRVDGTNTTSSKQTSAIGVTPY